MIIDPNFYDRQPESHVMIDLETLDVSPTAKILSIGAFIFRGTNRGRSFYAEVHLDSYNSSHFTEDEETIKWWEGQGEVWKKLSSEENKQHIREILEEFQNWVEYEAYKPFVWSNGASFDIPILNHHFNQFGLRKPWNFWDECCMRTAISQTTEKIDKTEGVVHNALDDAVRQGRFLQSELGSSLLFNMEYKAWLKEKENNDE